MAGSSSSSSMTSNNSTAGEATSKFPWVVGDQYVVSAESVYELCCYDCTLIRVEDKIGNCLFKVVTNLTSNKLFLTCSREVTDAANNHLFIIERECVGGSIVAGRWLVYRWNREPQNILFKCIRQSIFKSPTGRYHIYRGGHSRNDKTPDFIVHGRKSSKFKVFHNDGQLMAETKKDPFDWWSPKPVFTTVYPGVDQAFIVAISALMGFENICGGPWT